MSIENKQQLGLRERLPGDVWAGLLIGSGIALWYVSNPDALRQGQVAFEVIQFAIDHIWKPLLGADGLPGLMLTTGTLGFITGAIGADFLQAAYPPSQSQA